MSHSYDNTASILDRNLPPPYEKPSPKRPKSTEPTAETSISTKVNSNAYDSIQAFVDDIATAADQREKELQEKFESQGISKGIHQQEKQCVTSIKNRLQALIKGDMYLRPQTFKKTRGDMKRQRETSVTSPVGAVRGSNKTILTLCGGERSAKQLFSSLAKSEDDRSNLADIPLPNGISTTNVVPIHTLEETDEKAPTIGESFPVSSKLENLKPPKPASRQVSTRSTSTSKNTPADASPSTKEAAARYSYYTQTLPTGRWLTYNTAPSTDQLTSPGSKRRHRDRALSTGEPQSAIDAETSAAHAEAKDDALFRSVYSSFAPSRDDYGAIIAQEQKNWVWWANYGEERFHEALQIREEELYGHDVVGADFEQEELDEKFLEEGINHWQPMLEEDAVGGRASVPESSEELLQEISELLEILHSHQRIRNLSQSTTTRPLQGQKEQLDHVTPSSAEVEVYENLQAQLVGIISSLPPYMLAKIDGEKLGTLRISSKIKILGKYQKGTLQEDDPSVKPRLAANPNPPYNSATASRGGYAAPPNQQYSQRPAYPAASGPRPSATPSYSNYSARPASASQYTGPNARPYNPYPQHQQQRASSFVDRFANGQLGQQTPQYSQYGSYRPQSGQQPSYSQQFPSPQARLAASTPGTQGYQPRPSPNPQYSYNAAHAISPQPSQHNSVFGSQVPASGQRPAPYHQHSSQYDAKSPHQLNGLGVTPQSGQARLSPAAERAGSAGAGSPGVGYGENRRHQGSLTPQPQLASGQTSRQNGTPAPTAPMGQANGVSG